MGVRRTRLDLRQADQRRSRIENGLRKRDERQRRDKRMRELVSRAQYPYTPAIRSWLSEKLDKPSGKITEQDVQQLLKS